MSLRPVWLFGETSLNKRKRRGMERRGRKKGRKGKVGQLQDPYKHSQTFLTNKLEREIHPT